MATNIVRSKYFSLILKLFIFKQITAADFYGGNLYLYCNTCITKASYKKLKTKN
ncbi:hypothetical protein MuYL_0987 [Mucilaginibacter xinganensis]|uniref:Uncharacterized protein n=1 Tax=Mucilaginibacter xinganensis TaxID=1234841 RepID=A0A223NSR8_9SPHI|nr:hypothetical protein MuYL_0987 [Mucilaginibacter xinganensis]